MSTTTTATVRSSRGKNAVERFVPPTAKAAADKNALYEGSGTKLADIPIVPVNLNKIDADHDLLKAFHAFLYGGVGKKTVRKKNIRSFSGFPDDDGKDARMKKLTESKKWTVAALRDLCTLLGLEKGGDKAEVVDRIVSFLASPDPSESKGPVAKKPKKAAKKRKSAGKGKQTKKAKREVKPRPLNGYMMFSREARAKVLKADPGLKPTEVTAKMGQMWAECSDAQKEKYKQQGIKEFEKKKGAVVEQEEDEEDEREDEGEDEGEEEGEDEGEGEEEGEDGDSGDDSE